MKSQLPLRAQPGLFWLGASLVAESLVVFVLWLLPDSARLSVMDFFLSGPLGIAGLLVVAFGIFGLTAWIAHRLGLGI